MESTRLVLRNLRSSGLRAHQSGVAKVQLRSQELRTALVSPSIADRKERMELWSDIARDGGEKTADRLRATELLGKAQRDVHRTY